MSNKYKNKNINTQNTLIFRAILLLLKILDSIYIVCYTIFSGMIVRACGCHRRVSNVATVLPRRAVTFMTHNPVPRRSLLCGDTKWRGGVRRVPCTLR